MSRLLDRFRPVHAEGWFAFVRRPRMLSGEPMLVRYSRDFWTEAGAARWVKARTDQVATAETTEQEHRARRRVAR